MNNNLENTEKEQQKPETRGRKPKKLAEINYTFDSLENTRKDLTRLTISFLNQEITEHAYRAAVYGINSVTKLLIHEKVEGLEQRIKEIEKARK